jgi:hypothetical protein
VTRLLAIGVIVAAALAGATAHAYLKIGTEVGGTIVGIRWASQPIRYFVKNRDVPGVSAPEFANAVARAFASWSAVPTAGIRAEFAGFVDAEPSADDNISVIGFQPHPELERVLGTTSFTLDNITGEILESDIFLNSSFNWSVAQAGEAGRYDVEAIAAHEIGHLLGLGHSALGETELLSSGNRRVLAKRAVMFPIAFPTGNIDDRSLEADDAAGVSDIYANTAFNRDTGSISGSVTENGRGLFGAHVVAHHVGTGAMHATFSLSPGGGFVLAGLSPGVYVLRAEPIDDADVDSFFDGDANIDVDFRPAYAATLAIVPGGGRGDRVDIAVEPK